MTEYTTHTPNVKRLERTKEGRMVAGVSAGLGRYFDITPTVFRLAFVVLTLLGGAGILVYIAAVLVIPAEGEDASYAERALAERSKHPGRLVGLAILGIAILSVLSQASTWPSAGAAWVLAAVGLAVLLFSSERRPRKLVAVLVTTVAVLIAGVVAAVAIAFSAFDVSLSDGVGERSYAPATIAEAQNRYELGIGSLELDLSNLPARQKVDIAAKVGIGELRIIVPRDATVAVDSHVRTGSIDALGREDEGSNARVETADGRLALDLYVGAGLIEVDRAP